MARLDFDPDGRNLRFTAEVVLAAALARDERQQAGAAGAEPGLAGAFMSSSAGTQAPGQGYEFTLLAASARPEMVWPQEGWRDTRHLLAAHVEPGRDELRLYLQAEGFAALSEVSGRAARVWSREGVIDQQFRFDAWGRGLVVLGDSPEVRRALRRFQVWLVD